MAWSSQQHRFDLLSAVLTVLRAVFLHASVNVLNDYFDYRSGIDLATIPTPFSGRSTILPSKLMRPGKVLAFGTVLLGVGLAIGAYFMITFAFDPVLVGLVAIAGVSVVSYSSVTSKTELDELVVRINFGPLLLLGTYYLQTHTINAQPIVIGIVKRGKKGHE